MLIVNVILFLQPRACGAAVAQGTHNPLVVGSNPSGPNLTDKEPFKALFLCLYFFLEGLLQTFNFFFLS